MATACARDLFVRVLEQVRQRYQFVVVGYVAMPEHFHLLISEPEKANPSIVIQALKLSVRATNSVGPEAARKTKGRTRRTLVGTRAQAFLASSLL